MAPYLALPAARDESPPRRRFQCLGRPYRPDRLLPSSSPHASSQSGPPWILQAHCKPGTSPCESPACEPHSLRRERCGGVRARCVLRHICWRSRSSEDLRRRRNWRQPRQATPRGSEGHLLPYLLVYHVRGALSSFAGVLPQFLGSGFWVSGGLKGGYFWRKSDETTVRREFFLRNFFRAGGSNFRFFPFFGFSVTS